MVLGGLHVIGTNRHESRRTDDQLPGRAGREFAELMSRIDDEIVKAFLSARITRGGIDLESEGLRGPAST